jgi:penicillin-insensitive murein DD-endopeptidase
MKPLLVAALIGLTISSLTISSHAFAQTIGTLDNKPLPPLANPSDPSVPAKELFGRALKPAPLSARSIGSYARGCLAGAKALSIDGETWQAMRLSRGRVWGHPVLIDFLERFARRVPAINGWPGLLVGDISQARGGPMITGHASHQVGLDADLWLTPMPDRRLTREERETLSATNVVAEDWNDVNPAIWSPAHVSILKAAASEPGVARVFVNPAIKKALCREAGSDRRWLYKIRPMYGHNYHFHIRMACPKSDGGCSDQEPPPSHDGCGADLDWWFSKEAHTPKPSKPRPPMPQECRTVLHAQ